MMDVGKRKAAVAAVLGETSFSPLLIPGVGQYPALHVPRRLLLIRSISDFPQKVRIPECAASPKGHREVG